MNKYLPFISDEKLILEVKRIADSISNIQEQSKRDVYKNSLDPFSAIFDVFSNDSNLEEWMKKETSRQLQKALQNKVGEFHQNILGNCLDWEVVDNVIDIRSNSKKIIAEIKNKHNTTKGSDQKGIYTNLATFLKRNEYKGFIGFYVEIIPHKPVRYNLPFTPSNNLKHKTLKIRKDIRRIDGASFYELATGYTDALWQLYNVIPKVIEDLYSNKFATIKQTPLFNELFQKTFK